jgi:segregation and condensation protein B
MHVGEDSRLMFGSKGVKRVEPNEFDEDINDESDGFSLEELGTAYAHALGQSTSTATESSQVVSSEGDGPLGVDAPSTPPLEQMLSAPIVDESDGIPVTPESILEAMLFLGSSNNQPLSIVKLMELFRGVTAAELDVSIDKLNRLYREHGHVVEIVRELGGFRMQLVSEMHLVRDRFYGKVKETQLTQAAIDCLALVAYQPGITREGLEKQWNQPAASMLSLLVRKGLLKVEKSTNDTVPTSQYFTTDRFLEVIGLESLHDLPLSEELN